MIDAAYATIGRRIIKEGELKEGRNGYTLSIFGTQLKHDMMDGFPIISLRRIFTKGIVGEFKSFIEDATTLEEFEANGCKYWEKWADSDGSLRLDYPPRKQLDYVIALLLSEPNSRRMIIDLWNPENRGKLSLDPCHTQYQFYVRGGYYLDMIWTQRSVDYAIGMPSDLILAALYVIYIGQKVGLKPGIITYNLGDTHLYVEHETAFAAMLNRPEPRESVGYYFNNWELTLLNYNPHEAVHFELKA